VTGTLSSLFTKKDKNTGEKFKAGLQDPHKCNISFLTVSLQRAFDFFDFISKRNALLVFHEPSQAIKLPYEVFLLQDLGKEIEQQFAFIGVTNTSSELALLEKYLPRKDVPVLLAFGFDELGEFCFLGSLMLTQETLKNKSLMGEYLKTMSGVANERAAKFEVSYESLKRKIHGSQPHAAHDPYNDPYEDPYNDQETHNIYGQPQEEGNLDLRKQMSSDRKMKISQDQAYEDMLKKIEVDKLKKHEEEKTRIKEAEGRKKKEQEMLDVKRMFETEKVDPKYLIQISLRFPNGQRVVRDFDRRSLVKHVLMFVSTFEEKGFENATADFNLAAGFPPKVLEKEVTLESIFGSSENEMVHVKEV